MNNKVLFFLLLLSQTSCIITANLPEPITINTDKLQDFYNAIQAGASQAERLDIALNAFLNSDTKTLSQLLTDPTDGNTQAANNRMKTITQMIYQSNAEIADPLKVTELETYAKAASLSIEYNRTGGNDKSILRTMWDTLRFSKVGRFVTFATRNLSPEGYTAYAATAKTPEQLLATIEAATNADRGLKAEDVITFQTALLDQAIKSRNKSMIDSFNDLEEKKEFLLTETLKEKLAAAKAQFKDQAIQKPKHQPGIFTKAEIDFDFSDVVKTFAQEIQTKNRREKVDYFLEVLFNSPSLAARLQDRPKYINTIEKAMNTIAPENPLISTTNQYCRAKTSYDSYLERREPVQITNFWTALEAAGKAALKISDALWTTTRFLRKITDRLQPKDYLAFAREAQTPEQLKSWFDKAKEEDEKPKNMKIGKTDNQTYNTAEPFLTEEDKDTITRKMAEQAKAKAIEGDSTLFEQMKSNQLLSNKEIKNIQQSIDIESKKPKKVTKQKTTKNKTKSLKELFLPVLKKEVDDLSLENMITNIKRLSENYGPSLENYFYELLRLDLYSQKIANANTNKTLLVTQKSKKTDFSMANMLPQNTPIYADVIKTLNAKKNTLEIRILESINKTLNNEDQSGGNEGRGTLTQQNYDEKRAKFIKLKEILDFIPTTQANEKRKKQISDLYDTKARELISFYKQYLKKTDLGAEIPLFQDTEKSDLDTDTNAFDDDFDIVDGTDLPDDTPEKKPKKTVFDDLKKLQSETQQFLEDTLKEIKSSQHITAQERYDAFAKRIAACDNAFLKQLQLPDSPDGKNSALDQLTDAIFVNNKTTEAKTLVSEAIATKVAFGENNLKNFWLKSKALIKTKLINNPFVSLCKYLFVKIDIEKQKALIESAPTVTDLLQVRDAFYQASPSPRNEHTFFSTFKQNLNQRLNSTLEALTTDPQSTDARKTLYEIRQLIKEGKIADTTISSFDKQRISNRISALDTGKVIPKPVIEKPNRGTEGQKPAGEVHVEIPMERI